MNYVSHWGLSGTGTDWPDGGAFVPKQYTYVRWLNGAKELYDNAADPYQLRNLWDGRRAPDVMAHMRSRLADLLTTATTIFLLGQNTRNGSRRTGTWSGTRWEPYENKGL